MTRHGPALLALAVVAVAGWAYSVNYDTRAALDRVDALRGEIGEQREALQVLRVEWAYLNAPDRLAGLVARHNDVLALVPLAPESLGYVAAIPYPPRESPIAAPSTSDALVASAPGPVAVPASAPGAPEPGAVARLADAAPEAPTLEAPTLEAAIDAALAEAGAAAGEPRPGLPRSGVFPVSTDGAAGIFVASAPGVPVPAARPVAWSRR